MRREDIVRFALTLSGAMEDYPFDDPDFTVLRHIDNRKWFALIFTLNGRLCINVKTSPWEVDALCEAYTGITHGWHMNKRHWITIDINSDVSFSDIQNFIQDSYMRTSTKKRVNK